MLFSSLSFLFLFLPLTIIVYYTIGPSLRNLFLLVASLVFYAWGDAQHVVIMLGVIIINYFSGLAVSSLEKKKKKIALIVAVVLNLIVLGFYKYMDFFIVNANLLLGSDIELMRIALPIGISFYIFQSLSYTVDVYRGNAPVQKSFLKFALYVSLFPQLVAGPIVRYSEIVEFIDKRKSSLHDVAEGLRRFIIGLGKKVILANTMGEVADKVFASGPMGIDTPIAWLGIIAYTLQIFFDFSGYSDMAIGLGRIFGFRFLENFNYPYISKSITEFWRRWHMSLGRWFKEYVYIPLGGNKCSETRHYWNLLAVFMVTGMWHGASWNFIIWGLWNGIFVLLEKRFMFSSSKAGDVRSDSAMVSISKHVYAMLAVIFGFVIFRSDDMPTAIAYFQVLFGIVSPENIAFSWDYYFNNKVLVIGAIAVLMCYPWKFIGLVEKRFFPVVRDIALIAVLLLSILYVAGSAYNPFIYFRF